MNNEFSYFQNSLPSLNFEGPPSFSVSEFLELAGRYLTPKTLRTLGEATFRQRGGGLSRDLPCDVLSLIRLEESLRRELARLRWIRLGRKGDPGREYGGVDPEWKILAEKILGINSPELALNFLQRFLWHRIEEREFLHNYNLERICFYSLKLQILIQRNRSNRVLGRATLQSLIHT